MSDNTIPILETATPLAGPDTKPNILRVEPNKTWYYIKMLFLLMMIVLLGLNVYYYMTEGVTFFAKMMDRGVKNTENEVKKGAETIEKALKEDKKKKDLEKDDDEDVKLDLKKTLEKEDRGNNKDKKDKDKKDDKDKTVPSPDLSSHDDLQRSKRKYCYVGNLGGKRSCAEIHESDKCISGDIFPSEELCINPNLRR
tara:strand:+ start:858 stop:1448 length:591 start_codon:yes stop_codon:yes gene_type:complete